MLCSPIVGTGCPAVWQQPDAQVRLRLVDWLNSMLAGVIAGGLLTPAVPVSACGR
jgi:hypothetical protein